jgi:hypothetical protein
MGALSKITFQFTKGNHGIELALSDDDLCVVWLHEMPTEEAPFAPLWKETLPSFGGDRSGNEGEGGGR